MFSVVFEVFVVAYIRAQKASGQRNGFNLKWVSLTLSWHNTQSNTTGHLKHKHCCHYLWSLFVTTSYYTSHCAFGIISIIIVYFQHYFLLTLYTYISCVYFPIPVVTKVQRIWTAAWCVLTESTYSSSHLPLKCSQFCPSFKFSRRTQMDLIQPQIRGLNLTFKNTWN